MEIKEIKKMIHDKFEYICTYKNGTDIENYVKEFNVDVNYDDGNFLEIIACRNDLELFKMMVRLGGDTKLNNHGSLRLFAHKGNLDAVKYIINECDGDYKCLLDTTALTNHQSVHDFFKLNYLGQK